MRKALANPDVKARLEAIGAESIDGSPDELRDYLAAETAAGKKLMTV